MSETILAAQELGKSYQLSSGPLEVLKSISFQVNAGEVVSIVGPSGSGKSTLLSLCAGLDVPSAGKIISCGSDLGALSEDERTRFRLDNVGFIFQNFQLIPTLTALENVMVPMEIKGERNASARAKEVLSRLGLMERLDHYPTQLSGGEQQRVAIARSFSNRPRILFADEPTGNLDGKTSDSIEDLLFELNSQEGTTLVIVTHDQQLAKRTQRIFNISNGSLAEQAQ